MILSLIGMVGIRQIFLAWATARWPGELMVIYFGFPLGWGSTMVILIVYILLIRKAIWKDAELRFARPAA